MNALGSLRVVSAVVDYQPSSFDYGTCGWATTSTDRVSAVIDGTWDTIVEPHELHPALR